MASSHVLGAWYASLKCTVEGVAGTPRGLSPSASALAVAFLYEKYKATAAPAAATAGAARTDGFAEGQCAE